MQVDQDLGLHQLLVDDGEQPLVKPELVFRQVDLGEQQAFGEQIIGDGEVLEKVFLLNEFLQLLEALRHEKQFQGEGILRGVLIELGEKGVVGKLLQHQPGIEVLGEQVGEGGLAGAYIPFYGNEIILQAKLVRAAK